MRHSASVSYAMFKARVMFDLCRCCVMFAAVCYIGLQCIKCCVDLDCMEYILINRDLFSIYQLADPWEMGSVIL